MPATFADLLRRYRLAGRLTQEALADRAGVSARSVRELEHGRTPRPSSVERLAAALDLTGGVRDEFVRAGTARYRPRRTPAPPAVPAPHQLPADLPDFVGRTGELAEIEAALRDARVVVVSGPPGVGKTALAVHVGNRVADAFPDGQLFAVLRDPAGDPVDPADVLADLLRDLDVDGSALPAGLDARATLFRSRLAGRRILILLDDAVSHTQVVPMLPAGAAAAVVTSRLPLTGLPGVAAVDLGPLAGPVAVDLLGRVAGAARVAAEPAAAAALVEVCGGLPLAVRVAGAKLAARPQWTLGILNERLADERGRLDELRHGDLAVRTGLRFVWRGLGAPAGRAFALLGALPVRSFPEWTVAALLDCAPSAGTAALEELVDSRLVDPTGPDQAGQPRYRFHDVSRLFARECRESTVDGPQWTTALARAAGGWLTRARSASAALHCEHFHLDDHHEPAGPEVPRPVAWFEAEREALVALVPACVDAGLTDHARRLAGRGADFFEFCAYYDDWRRVSEAALAGCRSAGDRTGTAAMLRSLGAALVELGDLDRAMSTLRQAKDLATEVSDRREGALAGKDLGFALGLAGRLPDAEAELRAAADGLADVGLPANRAIALSSLGFVRRERGDVAAAVRTLRSASTVARGCGDLFAQAYVGRGLAGVFLADGRPGEAERTAARAAALFDRVGDAIGAAQSRRVRGEALAREPARSAEARQVFTDVIDVFRRRGYDWGLALCELCLGEVEVREGVREAPARLHRALRYWTRENVPALQARTLVALADAAERDGAPDARRFLRRAHRLYVELSMPAADAVAARLAALSG
ncbi:helix-turn-helix domain-containing protein [Virgisporangium aurantiacum]|uniref:HTH cro/C1-type domain-containing protein n=1 Tax=Virgisporangium aurantiacum TaxID=175570 RepID=A0A8J4E0P6_9ACTN|nr:helix-turn-helix transcriptional regulator [Virgisporangium aurantiacum]GIJ57174.1 hypothetical protein Vau01_046900 [Virgisporangium aurantiacum]